MPLEYAIRLNTESIIVCVSVEELHFMTVASGSFWTWAQEEKKGKGSTLEGK